MTTIKLNKGGFLQFLYYLCLISLVLGQFAVVFRGIDLKIYAYDLSIGIFCILGFVYFAFICKKIKVSGNLLWLFGFSLVAMISLAYNSYRLSEKELLVSAFYFIRWLFYLGAGLVTYNMVLSKIIPRHKLLLSVFYAALAISLAGFVQLVVLPDFTVLDPILGWDPHKNRLASTFFDPNFTGAFLAISLTLFLGEWFNGTDFNKKKWIFLFFIPLIALFLTFSRSSWAMFAIAIFIYGIVKSRGLLVAAILVAFLAYFAIPRVQTRLSGTTDPADSAAFRLVSWDNTLEIAKDNIFLGVGYNSFKFAQEDYGFLTNEVLAGNSSAGSDSSFLLILATTGIVGFVFFSVGYFLPAIRSPVLLALLLGLFIQSQFINAIFYPQIMFLWISLSSSYLLRS